MKPSVAVVGAGLAGIAAAAHLSRTGFRVTLIEKNPQPGGRCLSFPDPVTGDLLDNGQHLLMGCYRETLSLLNLLGTGDRLRALPPQLNWLEPGGNLHTLPTAGLIYPFSLLFGWARLGLFRWADRWAIGRALLAIWRLDESSLAAMHRQSCASWLQDQRQTPAAIERFWKPLIVSSLNEEPSRAAADLLAIVVQKALLSGQDANRFLLPESSLLELFHPEIENLVQSAGGSVLLKTPVRKIFMEHGLVSAMKTSGEETISADFYVLALPPWALYDLLAASPLEGLEGVRSLAESHRSSPIVTVYFWLKNRVWTESLTALLDSPIDWVFDLPVKEEAEYRQRLSVVISAARDWIDREPKEILKMTVSELSRYRPGIDLQAVAHGRVVKDRRATVSLGPRSNLQRPEPETGCPNLFLAGDWIATGLPATIEGAVLSGRLCAEALIARSGRGD